MNSHLGHPIANTPHVSKMSAFGCQQPGDYAVDRLAVPQPAKLPVEGGASEDGKHDGIVRYNVHYEKCFEAWRNKARGRRGRQREPLKNGKIADDEDVIRRLTQLNLYPDLGPGWPDSTYRQKPARSERVPSRTM